MKTASLSTVDNVITLMVQPKAAAPVRRSKPRFRIVPFDNRAGSQSWRVTGIKRDGTRIRENFAVEHDARCRCTELEAEFWSRTDGDSALRATKLTDAQLRLCEAALIRLDSDVELMLAVDHWLKHGRQTNVAQTVRIDEAVTQFKAWLENQPEQELSHRTKMNLRLRVDLFANSIGNLEVATINGDTVARFLEGRNVSKRTKTNDRLVLSRFFSWCKERKWTAINAARKEEKSKRTPRPSPAVLTVDDAKRLLRAAEKHRKGRLAPYVAVCLFGGLRPFEAARLTARNLNLEDGEIRLEAHQCKTRRPRTIKICSTLRAWLEVYKGKPFYPPNWRSDFDDLRRAAGFGNPETDPKLKPWTEDVMRHTAVSHYFRQCGSYGLTAEWAGNSEQIIKDHYQGRVSSEDTKAFYALCPKKGRK